MTPVERFCQVADFIRKHKGPGCTAQELRIIGQCSTSSVHAYIYTMHKHGWIKPNGTKEKKNVPGNKPILWRWCAED